MPSDLIGVDQFAAALDDIMDGVQEATTAALNEGVRKGIRKAGREWRKGAKSSFKGTGRYAASIRTRVDKGGDEPEAHAYSTMPGLPHLLEKGHATIGGGFVSGRTHIAPAAEDGFEEAFDVVSEEIEKSL